MFAAIGGGAYAATTLPANTVGSRQLKNDAVTPTKVAPSTVTLFKGQTGARGIQGPPRSSRSARSPRASQELRASKEHRGAGAERHDATTNGVAAGGGLTGTYPNASIAAGAVAPSNFGTIPAVRVSNSVNESIPNTGVTAVTFDSTLYDNASIHSNTSNNTRLTAPLAGLYDIVGEVVWESDPTGDRRLVIRRNGVHNLAADFVAADPASQTAQEIVTQARLNAGDYVELFAGQSTASFLDVSRVYRPAGPGAGAVTGWHRNRRSRSNTLLRADRRRDRRGRPLLRG